MSKKSWYDNPTQVVWYDYDNDDIMGGIAVDDFIICADCGGKIDLVDYYSGSDEAKVVPVSWISFNEEMFGTEYFRKKLLLEGE